MKQLKQLNRNSRFRSDQSGRINHGSNVDQRGGERSPVILEDAGVPPFPQGPARENKERSPCELLIRPPTESVQNRRKSLQGKTICRGKIKPYLGRNRALKKHMEVIYIYKILFKVF